MELHEEDIAILEHELDCMRPFVGALARTLDARLFTVDPSLRVLFQLPISGGGEKLTAALASLIGSLRRPAVVAPLLADLGARFARRGVRERDYHALASVVIAAIGDVLDDELTDFSRVAWAALADETTALMIEGARDAFAQAVAV